jgi:asparagine synthase (glutamine-hydrolysing)
VRASPALGAQRVERTFVGTYGTAAPNPLSTAVSFAGWVAEDRTGPFTAAWTGPPAPAPPSAERSGCLLDGEIYNLEQIARLAGVPPHPAPEATLAAAYEQLGEKLVAALRGEFALLLWDARARTGLLARDQLGAGNVFVHSGTGRLLFASEVRALLGALPRTPAPDRQAVVHWLADGTVPADKTMYESVVTLPPASVLRLRDGRWAATRYWTPRYFEPRRLDAEAAAADLRRAIAAAVGRRLHGRRTAGVLVSGGLDSGSVFAVASGLAAAGEASLRAYSAVFPGYKSLDEGRLARLQVDHHGLPSLELPVDHGSALRAGLRYLDRWGVPLPVPGHFVWEPLLERAARDGAECMLDGEGGDELFGAAVFLLADRLRGGRVGEAFRLARDVPGAGPSPSRRFLLSLLYHHGIAAFLAPALTRRTVGRAAVPRWLRRADARLFARSWDPQPWRGLEGPRWWAQLAHAVTRGPDLIGFWDYYQRRGRAAGIPAHHPFLDLDLIELVLRLPPQHGFDPNLSRPLLRRAMRGIMPEEVLARRDKCYFDALLVDSLAIDDRKLITRLLSAPDAEIASFADGAGVRALLRGGPSRHPLGASSWLRDVWRLANAECWLRSQRDPSVARALLDELCGQDDHAKATTRGGERSYVSHP